MIESLKDVRPGDIMFGPIGGLVGVGVNLSQLMLGEGWSVADVKIAHVGIVVQAHDPEVTAYSARYGRPYSGARMVQAMPRGAEEVPMFADKHWTKRHAYVRLAEDWPGQADDAAAIARAMVRAKVAYSFASYGALALWRWGIKTPRLEAWIGRRQPDVLTLPGWSNGPGGIVGGRLPVEAICSVLVDQAWTLAGKSVMEGVPHQVVTPGALAGRLLFDTPTARWTFPREIR